MASESQRRANKKYRENNLDKCRQLSRAANKKRYNTDPIYRQKCKDCANKKKSNEQDNLNIFDT